MGLRGVGRCRTRWGLPGQILILIVVSLCVCGTFASDHDSGDADALAKAKKLAEEWEQRAKKLEGKLNEAEGRLKETEAKEKSSAGEFKKATKAAESAKVEAQDLKIKVSKLEVRLKDAEALAQAKMKDASDKERDLAAKFMKMKMDSEMLELQVSAAEKLKKKKDEELKRALKDVAALTGQLDSTESKLQQLSSVVSALEAVLPAHASQLKGKDANEEGEGLLERARQAVAHQTALASELERTSARLQESEAKKRAQSNAEAEQLRCQDLVRKLQKEAQKWEEELLEVSQQWLPPWLADALESAQERAKHHWEKDVFPALITFKDKSVELAESTHKHVKPLIANFIQSTRELAVSAQAALKPQLATAWEKHGEAMDWVKGKGAEAQAAAAPHLKVAYHQIHEFVAKANNAAAPHLQKAWDVVGPHATQYWQATQVVLEAAIAAVEPYRKLASEALVPQLGHLAEASLVYREHVVGMLANVTHRVSSSAPSVDVVLVAEIALYAVVAIVFALLITFVARLLGGQGSEAQSRKAPAPGKSKHSGASSGHKAKHPAKKAHKSPGHAHK